MSRAKRMSSGCHRMLVLSEIYKSECLPLRHPAGTRKGSGFDPGEEQNARVLSRSPVGAGWPLGRRSESPVGVSPGTDLLSEIYKSECLPLRHPAQDVSVGVIRSYQSPTGLLAEGCVPAKAVRSRDQFAAQSTISQSIRVLK